MQSWLLSQPLFEAAKRRNAEKRNAVEQGQQWPQWMQNMTPAEQTSDTTLPQPPAQQSANWYAASYQPPGDSEAPQPPAASTDVMVEVPDPSQTDRPRWVSATDYMHDDGTATTSPAPPPKPRVVSKVPPAHVAHRPQVVQIASDEEEEAES